MNLVGGPSFVAACCQHTNVGTGDIVTTIGGNLSCQYVIHAVCCDWNSTGAAEQVSFTSYHAPLLYIAIVMALRAENWLQGKRENFVVSLYSLNMVKLSYVLISCEFTNL